MNYTGYSVLEIPKTGAAFSYAKEARDFATGATGVGGYLNSAAVSNSWTDVRFISAIYEGSTSLPLSIGATLPDLYTGAATVIGGSTPIGDLRSEDGPYVGVGNSSVYYTKKGQEYGAAFYATYIGGTNSAPTKIGIGTTSTDISTSGYYEGSFTTREIYEFETSFTPDLDDLTKTITGSGVYKNGDSISLQFNILNRNGELLTSAAQIAADPFIDKQVISILDVDSNVVFPNYRDNGDSTFTFSRSQNIDVFGTYTRNFGVRNEIVNKNGLTSTGEFYLYGNTTTFDNILVQASGQTVLNENLSNHSPPDTGSITSAADRADAIKYFNNQPVNTSGSTGFIELSLAFNEDPTFTEYSNLNIWASDTENFDSNIGNFLGSFPLDFSQEGQTIRLTPDNGIQDGTGLFFKLAVESSVEFEKEVFNLGPFTIEPIVEGPDLNLYNQGDQSMVGDFTIEGGLEGDSSNGGNLNVSGNALGTGIGGRLTGPESKMYLLSGDAGTESDTLQSVTARGNTTLGLDVNFQDGTLFVDHTNQRVGIGTNIPQDTLEVVGDAFFDGNVGIGTANPTVELDVAGAGKFTSQVTIPAIPSASTDAASKGYVDAQVGSADTLQEVTANGNTTDQGIEVTAGGIKVNDYLTHYGDTDTYLGFPSNNNFELYTAGGSALAIDPSQNIYFHKNVGIGSNGSSSQKLFVAGNFVQVEIATSDGYSIKSEQKAIIAGIGASIFSTGSAILGGSGHHVSGDYDTIAGGTLNNISGGNFNFIGGGSQIDITGSEYSSSIGGKNNDLFNSDYSVIGGGQNNKIEESNGSFIGGGFDNLNQADFSAIGGGTLNKTTGNGYSFIGGGEGNEVHSVFGGILAGENNIVSGDDSAIVGSSQSKVFGVHSLIAGGKDSVSSGDYSFTLGRQALIPSSHDGAAVFADGQSRDHISSGAHTATLDFDGGVYVPTSGMFGQGLFVSGVPVLTGEINPPEVDTLQTVTTRGNETTTSIISTGPYISGVTGLFSGKVGIGVSDPSYPLEVAGNIFLQSDNRQIFFGGANTFIGESSNSQRLQLRGGGSTSSDTVIIDNDAKMGFGTIPSYGLHLKTNPDIFFEGNIAQNDYLFDGGGENLTVFRDPDNTNRTYLTFDKDDQLYVGRQGSVDLIVNGSNSLNTLIQTDASENDVFFPDGKYGFGFEGVEPSALVHVSGNSFFDGNVGIGVSDPTTKLEVSGAVLNSLAAFKEGSQGVEITTRGSNRQQIDFLGSNSSTINAKASLFINYDSDNGGSNDSIYFARNGADAAGTVDMIITEGDVGIGTTSPDKKLTVASNGVADGFQLETSSGNTYATLTNANSETFPVGSFNMNWGSNNTFRAGVNNNEGYVRGGSNTNGKLVLQAYQTDVATIRDHGLGIFQDNPSYTLDVSGSGHFVNDLIIDGSTLGTGDGNRITNNHVPYLLSGDSPAETQTLQDVCDNGDETTTSIFSTGPYISGVTGLFNKEFHVGDLGSNSHAFNFEKGNGAYDTNIVLKPFGNPGGFNSSYWMTVSKQAYSGFITNGNNSDFYIGHDLNKTALKLKYDGGGVSTFSTSNADINFEDGTLFVDESAQRVGIGITSPSSKLDVYQTSSSASAITSRVPYKTNADSQLTQRAGLKIDINEGATSISIGGIGSSNGGFLQAYQTSSSSTDRPFVINPFGGKVGTNYGVNDGPDYDFDVNGTGRFVGNLYVQEVVSGSGSFLGTGDGNRITNNGVPYLLSGDSPAETQTLQDVTDNGNTTTNDIITSGDVQADEFIGDLRGAVSFRAKAAEALSAGEVVFISGIDGNTTVVAKADANDPTRMPAFGVSKETVNANANVRIVNFGSVSNINTSSYSEGDELFVSNTAGLLTGIAPTGESSALQKMAKVTRSHASAGSITVMGAGRTNAVPNLNEGNLFVGDSNNQAVADDTINVDIANSTVGISGVLSIPSGRAVASEDVYYIVKLTQAEYDALTPDASTMYIITDEDFNSPVINPIKTVASNYTITDTDYTILVSGSSTVNITLPSATINSNYVYNIKNITTNSVVVTPSAGYIDGDISKTINQKFESIATQSDGSNWYII